jgi:hypothetical protein
MDKLKALQSELDAGLRTAQGYTAEKAVADWRIRVIWSSDYRTPVQSTADAWRPPAGAGPTFHTVSTCCRQTSAVAVTLGSARTGSRLG